MAVRAQDKCHEGRAWAGSAAAICGLASHFIITAGTPAGASAGTNAAQRLVEGRRSSTVAWRTAITRFGYIRRLLARRRSRLRGGVSAASGAGKGQPGIQHLQNHITLPLLSPEGKVR